VTRLRTATAALFGCCLPAGLIAALYAADWRHAVAGLVLGLVGLVVGTAPGVPGRTAKACGERSGFRYGDPPTYHECARTMGHDGPHEAGGVQWGEIERPWPDREEP
jgi:hypothetical protein